MTRKPIKGIDFTPEERLAAFFGQIDAEAKRVLVEEGDIERFQELQDARAKTQAIFDKPISEKTEHGWMMPLFLQADEKYFGRWKYWLEGLAYGSLPKGPIPRIDFMHETTKEEGHPRVMDNINYCLRPFQPNISPITLVKWMLWSLGDSAVKEMPNDVSPAMNEHWYRSLEIYRFYEAPGDSMFPIYAGTKAGLNGFFPTPPSIVQMMTEMLFAGIDPEKAKRMSVNEPCCGTGIMLLYASNYSLNLCGQDSMYDMMLMSRLNSWLYMPWVVYPAPKECYKTEENKDGDNEGEIIIEETAA